MRSIFGDKTNATDLASAKAILEKRNFFCAQYLRVLYPLLKLIAINVPNSTIGHSFEADKIKYEQLSDDEKMYSSIVRSFLSYEVIQLLSINCYCTGSTDTYWKYKLLIEQYAFLEHMPFEIGNKENKILVQTISSYELSAFGNSEFVKNFHNQQHDTNNVSKNFNI